jgi:hypothetical protein
MDKMDCSRCGGKMVKLKYMHLEELSDYLKNEFILNLNKPDNYNEWLKTLNENDLVLTSFIRKDRHKTKRKYYLRLVEKTTKKGIKLKKLSKIFKFDTGELIYGNEDNMFSIKTTYKIIPIDEKMDKLIKTYCKSEENFDIDNLNKIITKELLIYQK